VLWHAREPFTSPQAGTVVDEGETRYADRDRYDFDTDVRFNERRFVGEARLFVTVLPVDPVLVRAIGRRPRTDTPDHVTFGVPHYHRHIKDYFVQDPRGILNPDRTTGAFGRTEWPPFNPPEQQWLFTDDLAGGWGKTRLEVQPAGSRATDRFLTVLVPADVNESERPVISRARGADGMSVAAVVQDADSTEVVIFNANPAGGDMARVDIELPPFASRGDVVITSLEPGARFVVRAVPSGASERLVLAQFAAGGATADQGGMLHLSLGGVQRAASMAAVSAETGLPVSAFTTGGGAMQAGGVPPSGPGGGSTGDQAAARHPGLVSFAATASPDREQWDRRVSRMLKAGELRIRESTPDTMLPGRTHQRMTQYYKGVPVFGGDVTRQVEDGRAVSLFGSIYQDITLDPVPKLTSDEAAAIFEKLSDGGLGPSRGPELMVLPMDDGTYRLTYRARIATTRDVTMYFIDANTGETVLSFSDLKRPVR
jgi:hypothetical protein